MQKQGLEGMKWGYWLHLERIYIIYTNLRQLYTIVYQDS